MEASSNPPPNETPKERVRRVAREWYWRNKDRLRAMEQSIGYIRRPKAGRPPKSEKVMIFNPETGQLEVPPSPYTLTAEQKTAMANARREATKAKREPTTDSSNNVPTVEITTGKFFVSFT